MEIHLEPLGKHTARLAMGTHHEPISEIPKEKLLKILEEAGVVLLRGFQVDLQLFSALVASTSSRITIDPSRRFHSASAQLVDAGDKQLELHSDNANSPFRPDLIWFFCNQAPEKDGQTTYCDGFQIWKHLSPSTRQLFEDNRIQYRRTYPAGMWKTYISHLLGETIDPELITEEHIGQALGSSEAVYYRLNPDGSLYTCFTCSAQYPALFNGEPSFANSIVGPYAGQVVVMEDGEPIPAAVMQEIRSLYEQFTEEIPWQDGDVALIDNTRFLHGRRSFPAGRRQIFAALSFA